MWGIQPGRLREKSSQNSHNRVLGSAPRGRLYPKQGVDRLWVVPGCQLGAVWPCPGNPAGSSCPPRLLCCRHLPSCEGPAGRFLPPSPATGIRPASLPFLLTTPLCAAVPGQQKSLAQGSLLWHSLHSLRCRRSPRPTAREAMATAGPGRSRCQNPGFVGAGETPTGCTGRGLWVCAKGSCCSHAGGWRVPELQSESSIQGAGFEPRVRRGVKGGNS